MTRTLSPLQSRMLALLLLALVIALVVGVTVVPVWTANRHYQDTIDGMQGRLEQLQRAAAIGTSLQPQHNQIKRWKTSNTHYLKSGSVALGGAELQRLVKRIAGAKGTEILSTQILPSREEQAFTRVAIKVRMRASLNKIVQVFHSMETGEPYLFLDKVSVRARGIRRIKTRGKINANTPQPLDVDFELIGYLVERS